MPIKGGRGVNGKITYIQLDDFDDSVSLMEITETDRDILLILSEQLDWKNRWLDAPAPLDNDDDRDAYIADLKLRLMQMIDFCERMINCITTDTDTQDALKAYILNLINTDIDIQEAMQQNTQQDLTDENPINVNQQGNNLLPSGVTCNLDSLNGSVISAIEWLNRNNEDFLDNLAVAATPAERGAAMSKGIPGYNGDALGEAASVAITFLTSQMVNQYDAFFDIAYENDLREEMFCLFKPGCEITIRQLYLLFAARIGYATPAETFYEGFLFAVTGSWTGTNFCDVMMFAQLGAFIFMGGFAGWEGLNPLQNAIVDGWNEPNSDWMTEYDCGDFWTHVLTATDITSGLLVLPDTLVGTITGTVITQTSGVAFGQDITGISFNVIFPSIQNIAGVRIRATNLSNIDLADSVNHFFVYRDAGNVNIGGTGQALPDSNDDWESSYSELTPGVKYIACQYIYLGLDQTMEFEVVISGYGTNPF